MKRKVLFCMIPIVLIVIATIVFLAVNNNPITKISAYNWIGTDEFVLCEVEAKSSDEDGYSVFFVPEDANSFINEIEANKGYLGNGMVSYLAVEDDNGYIFYYDDSLYSVMRWNEGFMLWSCGCDFVYFDDDEYGRYRYLSYIDYQPSNAESSGNYITFAESFNTYEKAFSFYGHLSERMVKFDDDRQQIRLRIYDTNNRIFVDDKCVCIDFNAKDVYVEEGITW